MGTLSLLQQIFPTQESKQNLLHCRGILYQAIREVHLEGTVIIKVNLPQILIMYQVLH